MALSAARRLSSSAAAAAARPGALSSLFAPRSSPKTRLQPPDPGAGPPERWNPRRRPWGEDATALLRRFYEGGYLPEPDLSLAPQVLSPDVAKAAAERFGRDHQVVANGFLQWIALFCSQLLEAE